MLINATLLAQIGNFLIGYLILRFLFFRPTFIELEKEKKAKINLENMIRMSNKLLEEKRSMRKVQWEQVQQIYIHNKPNLEDQDFYFFRNFTPSLKEPYISEKFADELVQKASVELKNKIRKVAHE